MDCHDLYFFKQFKIAVLHFKVLFSNTSDEKGKFDELVEDKDVKILVDPKALMHVIGTKMDFVDDKLRYLRTLYHNFIFSALFQSIC